MGFKVRTNINQLLALLCCLLCAWEGREHRQPQPLAAIKLKYYSMCQAQSKPSKMTTTTPLKTGQNGETDLKKVVLKQP